MSNEKRMAGSYEIIHAMQIGDKEIVIGEDPAAAPGQQYMCAFCEQNDFFARYEQVLSSDDYAEIVGIFGWRVTESAEEIRRTFSELDLQGEQNPMLTAANCTPITSDDDLNNKVVVIRPDVLRREFRKASSQIKICDGGFGASPNSRDSACYCVNPLTGETSRFDRMDILGILKEDQVPKWAQAGILKHQKKREKQAQKHKNPER